MSAANKVLPTTAAIILECELQTVYGWLIDGRCPFGTAFRKPGNTHYTYYINRERFKSYAGCTDEDIKAARLEYLSNQRDKWGSRGCRKKLPGRLREL